MDSTQKTGGYILSCENISKSFGGTQALKGVELHVKPDFPNNVRSVFQRTGSLRSLFSIAGLLGFGLFFLTKQGNRSKISI